MEDTAWAASFVKFVFCLSNIMLLNVSLHMIISLQINGLHAAMCLCNA